MMEERRLELLDGLMEDERGVTGKVRSVVPGLAVCEAYQVIFPGVCINSADA